MSYLGIFKPEFEKTIVIVQTSALEFFEIQNLMQNKKKSKFSTKNAF